MNQIEGDSKEKSTGEHHRRFEAELIVIKKCLTEMGIETGFSKFSKQKL